MKKWMIALTAFCVLLSGCGEIQKKPDTSEESDILEQLDQELGDHANISIQQGQDAPLPTKAYPSDPLAALPQASASAAPAPAAQVPPPPKPNAQPAPSRATAKPKASQTEKKKPSVPVHHNQSAHKSLTLSEIVSKYPDSFKLRGTSKVKKIALTFDDGPDEYFTPAILDVLKEHNVKATFFVIGLRAKAHPALVSRMIKEGHIVGNHSYNHANLPRLSVSKFESEIESTQQILRGIIGYTPKLIRPPYGAISEQQVKWAAEHHFLIVNWSVDSLDWKQLSAETVYQNIMMQTRPGSIILQHSGGGEGQDLSGTVKALPNVIRKLKASGYNFVTVPDLLHVPKQK